ncbi:predicted protein [Naegleria gruberi]|uniref:Predicted protein n=1 Tax=Naegleria gruberi TaxID=5762 RepID=D2V7F1_NAEGR|nr:uncharacterized protein NAEGRDRAFT_64774 [Naegleria gruberi]EFC47366.1 predicted protein [Naegleria gruberi]|eukprot:XP_002680110.1 predicted protein [Naegleria gruberi strain NEG-M]
MHRLPRIILNRTTSTLSTLNKSGVCLFQNLSPSSSNNSLLRRMSTCSKIPDKECPRSTQPLSSNSLHHPCWNCSEELSCNDLFCAHCNKIQPPSCNNNSKVISTSGEDISIDYFTLMDMPKEFSINPKVLHEKFKELQRVLHPDKFAMKSEVEKKISIMQSAIVNTAYQTLKNTKSRAEYLLKVKEIDLLGPCNYKSVNDVQLPPEFLMEIMEVNEYINEIDSDRDQLTDYHMDFNEKKRLIVKSIDEAFKKDDLDNVRINIAELNYIERTLQLVDNKLHLLDLKEHRHFANEPCADCEHNK